MNLAPAERPKVTALLAELARSIEELLLGGLTAASEATRQTLNVSFREASRMKLLRLSSTLRVANEELGRYTRNDPDFSPRRLSFFLNRTWLLSHGLHRALARNDDAEFDRLLWTPAQQPVESLEVVTLGVAKKVAARAFCAFEFRFRSVQKAGEIAEGARLSWSCVFPINPDVDIPAEGYLHLPQKQKFKGRDLLQGRVVRFQKALVALDGHGGGRISLADDSQATLGDVYWDWQRLLAWDPTAALARLQRHRAGPLDLDIEMQEEVALRDWKIHDPTDREQHTVFPITAGPLQFEAPVTRGPEGETLARRLTDLAKKRQRPPLFGLMHYERCRLVLQPLSVFDGDAPEHLMISGENIDPKLLLRALKMT